MPDRTVIVRRSHDGDWLSTAELATSGADGRFRLERIPSGKASVVVMPLGASQSPPTEHEIDVRPDQTLDIGDLRVPRGPAP